MYYNSNLRKEVRNLNFWYPTLTLFAPPPLLLCVTSLPHMIPLAYNFFRTPPPPPPLQKKPLFNYLPTFNSLEQYAFLRATNESSEASHTSSSSFSC